MGITFQRYGMTTVSHCNPRIVFLKFHYNGDTLREYITCRICKNLVTPKPETALRGLYLCCRQLKSLYWRRESINVHGGELSLTDYALSASQPQLPWSSVRKKPGEPSYSGFSPHVISLKLEAPTNTVRVHMRVDRKKVQKQV